MVIVFTSLLSSGLYATNCALDVQDGGDVSESGSVGGADATVSEVEGSMKSSAPSSPPQVYIHDV